MTAYYNEIDPYAAQWLRNLIAAGHIAPGVVDERSIVDVVPNELSGFTQCHFFAGIGVWSYALRRAGWADDRPIWTGSCPCQPFSSAGRGDGFADERHLWPAFFHLITQCRPAVVAGEQVASKAVDPWIDLVQADMEAMGYAFGAVAFPSAGVGAPHIRDRTFWLADASGADGAWQIREPGEQPDAGGEGVPDRGRLHTGRLGDALGAGLEGRGQGHHAEGGHGRGAVRPTAEAGGSVGMGHAGRDGDRQHARELSGDEGQHEVWAADCNNAPLASGAIGRLADADNREPEQLAREWAGSAEAHGWGPSGEPLGRGQLVEGQSAAGPTNGFWRDPDWLFCRDGKWRPVEPGTSPLAHGAPARVGRLRAYGNAINAEAAEAFIRSYLDD